MTSASSPDWKLDEGRGKRLCAELSDGLPRPWTATFVPEEGVDERFVVHGQAHVLVASPERKVQFRIYNANMFHRTVEFVGAMSGENVGSFCEVICGDTLDEVMRRVCTIEDNARLWPTSRLATTYGERG